MKDFNFFSPYLLEKRNKRLKRRFIFSVISLFTIGILSFTALNQYQIERYKGEIGRVENYLNAEETKVLLEKYEITKKKRELIDTYYNKVMEIDKTISSLNTVNTDLLNKLASVMPETATISSISISGRQMQINYLVDDMVTVAELEHNLFSLDIFENVNVSVINNEAVYTAVVNCRLKDVKMSEAKADK